MNEHSRDLVEADEYRKMEMKKLISENYEKRYNSLFGDLDRSSGALSNVNYINSQKRGMEELLLRDLIKAVKKGDVNQMAVLVQDHEKFERDMALKDSMSSSEVSVVNMKVDDFLKDFGLKKYVMITADMDSEQIKRAIDIGYEAKMWELTNRHE